MGLKIDMDGIKIASIDEIMKLVELGKAYREEGKYDLSVREFEKIICSPEDLSFRNMIRNEIEISQGKIILDSRPRGLGITLTNKCNIRCIMCNVWQNDWDLPEKTIKETIELFPYLQRIFWQGGEVFLSPYFQEILESIASHLNVRQDINTNALLIDERWAERLVKANVNIIISIDGVTKETYEYIRRGAKFDNLLRSIQILNECRSNTPKNTDYHTRGCSTIINLVVMKSNYHELGNFMDFAKKYHFDRLQLTPVDLNNSENIFLYKDEEALRFIRHIIPEMEKKAGDYGISLSNWLPLPGASLDDKQTKCMQNQMHAIDETRYNQQPLRPNNLSCYWPWQFLFIDWGGKARPQCFCRKEVGNIQDSSIGEIWNNQIMQEYRRRLFTNDCENWCEKRCTSGNISKEALGLYL